MCLACYSCMAVFFWLKQHAKKVWHKSYTSGHCPLLSNIKAHVRALQYGWGTAESFSILQDLNFEPTSTNSVPPPWPLIHSLVGSYLYTLKNLYMMNMQSCDSCPAHTKSCLANNFSIFHWYCNAQCNFRSCNFRSLTDLKLQRQKIEACAVNAVSTWLLKIYFNFINFAETWVVIDVESCQRWFPSLWTSYWFRSAVFHSILFETCWFVPSLFFAFLGTQRSMNAQKFEQSKEHGIQEWLPDDWQDLEFGLKSRVELCSCTIKL